MPKWPTPRRHRSFGVMNTLHDVGTVTQQERRLTLSLQSFTHKIDYRCATKYVLPREWAARQLPARKLHGAK